eukprot:3371907-Amphidinium_carterae.2
MRQNVFCPIKQVLWRVRRTRRSCVTIDTNPTTGSAAHQQSTQIASPQVLSWQKCLLRTHRVLINGIESFIGIIACSKWEYMVHALHTVSTSQREKLTRCVSTQSSGPP